MRFLLMCALLTLGGLGLLLWTSSSGTTDGIEASGHLSIERLSQRGSPGLAGVNGGDGTLRERLTGDEETVHAQQAGPEGASLADALASEIHVTLVGASGPLDPGVFSGVRFVAASLRLRAECSATFSTPGDESSSKVEATIEVPTGGGYRVLVDEASVPDGYVASGAHPLGPLDSSGIGAAFVDVPDGGEVEVILHVFRPSSLTGWVSGADGAGLAGMTVRAQGLAPGLAGLSHDVVTDVDGAFEIAGLLPVVYGVNVIDFGEQAEALDGSPSPPRQLFDLRHGPYAGVELRVGRGQVDVTGRVVDEDGQPFVDVSVLAYYAGDVAHGVQLAFDRTFTWSDHTLLTRTDGRGRFRLAGLYGVPIHVQVGAQEATNGPQRRARFVPPPVKVSLGPGSVGEVALGDVVLARSRRFVASGRIMLGAQEIDGTRLKYGRLNVQAVSYEPSTLAHGLPGQEPRPIVAYDRKTGAVSLSCDTTRPSCAFTVELRGCPETRKEFFFSPTSHGIEPKSLTEQVFVFP